MRLPGIEPGSPAWQADIMPLDHKRWIGEGCSKKSQSKYEASLPIYFVIFLQSEDRDRYCRY